MILELRFNPINRYRPPSFEELAPFLRTLRGLRPVDRDGVLHLQGRRTRIVGVYPGIPRESDLGEVQKTVVALEVDGSGPNQNGFLDRDDALASLNEREPHGAASYLSYIRLISDMAHLAVTWDVWLVDTAEYLSYMKRLGFNSHEAYDEFLDV